MTNSTMAAATTGKRPGRKLRYGERTEQVNVYLPVTLKDRLEREALVRNVREGVPGEWTLSRVAVDVLLEFFGLVLPQREEVPPPKTRSARTSGVRAPVQSGQE